MTEVSGGPVVILVDPQLGQNIGMAARAMLNCGLTQLRLVRPRDGWPNSAAESAAAGADEVLAGVRLFDTTAEAVADLQRVYAASARSRDLLTPVVAPRQAAAEMRARLARDETVGVLFGPERSGLVNDDIALADTLLAVPLNPAFTSLNLAQAVFAVGYEWFQSGAAAPARDLPLGATQPVTKAELVNFFERLEQALDDSGFLKPPEKRPAMVLNLRSMFQRADLTDQEVRTLHGVVTALTSHRARGGEET